MPDGVLQRRVVDPANERRSTRSPSAEAVATLKDAASALDVEDVLALCYAFRADAVRLFVYLDVLRGKGGRKAQAAACLVCFDLARRGEPRFEAEFLALVPVMHGFVGEGGGGQRAMEHLIGDSPYLKQLWSELEVLLQGRDPRWDHGSADEVVDLDAGLLEIELLDAEDLLDIDLEELEVVSANEERLRERWQEELDRFYGVDRGIRAMSQVGGIALSVHGFFAESKGDLARVEELLAQARSFADGVEEAAEMLPLIELFLASHTRAKNLFGRRSRARDGVLQAALEHFTALSRPPTNGAWLAPPTSVPASWEKVAEILLDYIAWLGALDESAGADRSAATLASGYVSSARPQPPPQRLAHADGPRRRR